MIHHEDTKDTKREKRGVGHGRPGRPKRSFSRARSQAGAWEREVIKRARGVLVFLQDEGYFVDRFGVSVLLDFGWKQGVLGSVCAGLPRGTGSTGEA